MRVDAKNSLVRSTRQDMLELRNTPSMNEPSSVNDPTQYRTRYILRAQTTFSVASHNQRIDAVDLISVVAPASRHSS